MSAEHIPSPEQAPLPDIPMSKEMFRGDINDAVIQTQLSTGVEIDKGWWDSEVGNHDSAPRAYSIDTTLHIQNM